MVPLQDPGSSPEMREVSRKQLSPIPMQGGTNLNPLLNQLSASPPLIDTAEGKRSGGDGDGDGDGRADGDGDRNGGGVLLEPTVMNVRASSS